MKEHWPTECIFFSRVESVTYGHKLNLILITLESGIQSLGAMNECLWLREEQAGGAPGWATPAGYGED